MVAKILIVAAAWQEVFLVLPLHEIESKPSLHVLVSKKMVAQTGGPLLSPDWF